MPNRDDEMEILFSKTPKDNEKVLHETCRLIWKMHPEAPRVIAALMAAYLSDRHMEETLSMSPELRQSLADLVKMTFFEGMKLMAYEVITGATSFESYPFRKEKDGGGE